MEQGKKDNPLASLDNAGLRVLASDIRADILSVCQNNGGHLSSNLGVVELTISLLKNFDYRSNDILFDVGHQAYTYKILTGRDIQSIRKKGGIAPFNLREESPYDAYSNGHAGDCVGTAIGMQIAKKLKNDNSYTIAFVGDASSENGLSYEAFDYLASHKDLKNLIVILNDNGMAISKNHGPLSSRFAKIRNSRFYFRTSNKLGSSMAKHKLTWKIFLTLRSFKDHLKNMVLAPTFFEAMGLKYIGPYDGHDFDSLDLAFEKAKVVASKGPVILHIITKKGYGFPDAANDEEGNYHGVSSHFLDDSKVKVSFTDVKKETLAEMMEKDKDITLITPAMENGSGLENLFKTYPDRCFDVGIQEENALLLASGMALKGKYPIIDIYSTFLQRGYDEVMENISRQNISCKFLIERAGLVGQDGASHHGIYDVAMLRSVPNIRVYMPFDTDSEIELTKLKDDSVHFIRFPKGSPALQGPKLNIQDGFAFVHNTNNKRLVIGVSSLGLTLCQSLDESFDTAVLTDLLPSDKILMGMKLLGYEKIYFYDPYGIEEGTSAVISDCLLRQGYKGSYRCFALKDEFITFGSIDELLKDSGLDLKTVLNAIKEEN